MFKVIDKPWGHYQDLVHEDSWHVKKIYVKQGEVLSLQSHKKRSEFWFVVWGSVIAEHELIERDGHITETILKVGDSVEIYKGSKHRMCAYKEDAIIIEISLGEFDEEDIERHEDKYGRKD